MRHTHSRDVPVKRITYMSLDNKYGVLNPFRSREADNLYRTYLYIFVPYILYHIATMDSDKALVIV